MKSLVPIITVILFAITSVQGSLADSNRWGIEPDTLSGHFGIGVCGVLHQPSMDLHGGRTAVNPGFGQHQLENRVFEGGGPKGACGFNLLYQWRRGTHPTATVRFQFQYEPKSDLYYGENLMIARNCKYRAAAAMVAHFPGSSDMTYLFGIGTSVLDLEFETDTTYFVDDNVEVTLWNLFGYTVFALVGVELQYSGRSAIWLELQYHWGSTKEMRYPLPSGYGPTAAHYRFRLSGPAFQMSLNLFN